MVSFFGAYFISEISMIFAGLWLVFSICSDLVFAAGQNLIKDTRLKKLFLYIGIALMVLGLIGLSYIMFSNAA